LIKTKILTKNLLNLLIREQQLWMVFLVNTLYVYNQFQRTWIHRNVLMKKWVLALTIPIDSLLLIWHSIFELNSVEFKIKI